MERKLVIASVLLLLAVTFPVMSATAQQKMPLAYGIQITEKNWIQAHQLVNVLLRTDIPVLWVAKPLVFEGKTLGLGDFVIPVSAPAGAKLSTGEINSLITYVASQLRVDLIGSTSDVELEAYVLRPIRIAMYGGHGGLPTPYVELFSTLGFAIEFIDDTEIKAGALLSGQYDVLAVPGDGSDAELLTLAKEGGAEVQKFVSKGGGYISSCAGSWAAAAATEGWAISSNLQLVNAKLFNVIEGEGKFRKLYPGIGVCVFKNVNPSHPSMWGMPETFQMVWWQGSIFKSAPKTLPLASDAQSLVVNHDFTDSFTAAEYYFNLEKQKTDGFKGTTVYNATSLGMPVVVAGAYGNGKVVLFGPHPEFKTMLTLNGFQYVPGRMCINAALWETANGPYRTSTKMIALHSSPRYAPQAVPYTSLDEVKSKLSQSMSNRESLLKKLSQLTEMYGKNPTPPWLPRANSWFGLAPGQMLKYYLEQIPILCAELEGASKQTEQALASLVDMHGKLSALEDQLKELRRKGNVEDLIAGVQETKLRLLYALYLLGQGVTMVPGPTVTYGGTQGVLHLTATALADLDVAIANYNAETVAAANEPLRRIGTYGAAGHIVHALNSLRGRTSYANAELLQAGFVYSKASEQAKQLQSAKTLDDLINMIQETRTYATAISVIIAAIAGLAVYLLVRKKK